MIVLILVSLYKVVTFLLSAGYLPPPFFDQSFDTFMDWYNTVYWSYRPGAYDEWGSVYPPFALLFMRLFSSPACYSDSAGIARECDPLGVWLLASFTLLNGILVYLDYKKMVGRTALPRALALGAGLPALFALERGNVIVACFTFFILAHGHALRSTRLRWLFFGLSLNLKPYLVVSIVGPLLRRRWRWLEGCAIASAIIYGVSYMLLGKGAPLELLSNILIFSGQPQHLSLDYIEYSTTFSSLLDLLKSNIPLMTYIGSRPIELAELIIPAVIKLGAIGVSLCLLGAAIKPGRAGTKRLMCLALTLFLSISKTAGGYAELFLVYLTFMETACSTAMILAISAAYALCIPWDFMLVRVIHAVTNSYLTGRAVGFDFGVTLGSLVRPALILVIEFCLVAATITDLLRNTPSPILPQAGTRPSSHPTHNPRAAIRAWMKNVPPLAAP